MPLVFIFFIWYGMYGRNNPKIYSKLHDKFGLIVFLLFIFSGLSSFSSSFGVLLLVSLIIAVVGAPFWLIAWLISKSAKGKARQKQNDYDYYTQHYSQSDAKAGMTVTGLTKAVPKRRKIIQKFNQKYDTISQWYRGDSAWLRAYLHAFPVQNVTSDFESQRSICLDTFYQVFSEIDPGKYESMESCVREINHRFMTNFDDITFSVAHRFLADNGYKFELPHFDVRGVKSDIDRLKDKYDQETAGSGSRSGYEKMRQR